MTFWENEDSTDLCNKRPTNMSVQPAQKILSKGGDGTAWGAEELLTEHRERSNQWETSK